jgi:hypothetical protein
MSDSSQLPTEEPGSAAGHKIGRWQFSLRGLMLFVLLAAMGIALFTTGWKLHRAEKQLDEYRREYGILKVENPAMLHAVARWAPEPGQWRWQVHFPPGRYDICYATTGILDQGFPKPRGGFTSDFSGDATVSATVFKDPKTGQWTCALFADHATTYRQVPDSVINADMSSIAGVQWNQAPAIISPEKPLVLLRKRVGQRQKSGTSSISFTDPSDGLMIWIQRVGEATGAGSVCW